MSFKCGIVGLPSVGKSTLVKALTKSGIAAENYPLAWSFRGPLSEHRFRITSKFSET